MHDPLTETEGCALLARVFRARGYAIKRDVTFSEYDVEFRVDGWDPRARVGFEFLSSEAEDHDDLTLREFKRLMAAQQRGELALFIVDEAEQLTAASLAAAAEEFLDGVAAAAQGGAGRSPQRLAKKPPDNKRPAKKAKKSKKAKKATRQRAKKGRPRG